MRGGKAAPTGSFGLFFDPGLRPRLGRSAAISGSAATTADIMGTLGLFFDPGLRPLRTGGARSSTTGGGGSTSERSIRPPVPSPLATAALSGFGSAFGVAPNSMASALLNLSEEGSGDAKDALLVPRLTSTTNLFG